MSNSILIYGRTGLSLTEKAADLAYHLHKAQGMSKQIGLLSLHTLPPALTLPIPLAMIHLGAPYTPARVLAAVERLAETCDMIVLDGLHNVWNGSGGVKQIAATSRNGWQEATGEPAWSTLLNVLAYSAPTFIVTADAKTEVVLVDNQPVHIPFYPDIQPQAESRFLFTFRLDANGELVLSRQAVAIADYEQCGTGDVELLVPALAKAINDYTANLPALLFLPYQNGELGDASNTKEVLAYMDYTNLQHSTPKSKSELRQFVKENELL